MRQHDAAHVTLQLLFELKQEVAMPRQESMRAGAAVAEVHVRRRWRGDVLDEAMDRDVLVPATVRIGIARVDDVGFHHHAGTDEGFSF